MSGTLAVICKEPVAGRVKTRLSPPFTLDEAARLAHAALRDTLAAVAAARCRRRVVVLDGAPGRWLPPGFDVIGQRGAGLADRLAAGFEDIGDGPILLVGMDTPQITPRLLEEGLRLTGEHGAVIGPAHDGGYWAIGLATPDGAVFDGVPVSTSVTGERQLARLRAHGLRPAVLMPLTDVDDVASAEAVAAAAPRSRFAAALAAISSPVAA